MSKSNEDDDTNLPLSERETLIVEYMSKKVGNSVEKMETNATELLKYSTGLLTILTTISAFFKVKFECLLLPIICLFIGILGFIKTVEPDEANYVVGEADSCIKEYEHIYNKKKWWLKIGYYFSCFGIICFTIIIVA